MSSPDYLQVRGLTKRYDNGTTIGPLSFSAKEGELISLLGPSGCGKSTTLHVVAGLSPLSDGAITVCGREVTRLSPSQRDMGVVFQSYALFPHKSVFQNVAFGLRVRKLPPAEIAAQVRAMLALVGLEGVEQRLPEQLSGGQRQRVALARALVIKPALLLLDEPLSNLDAVLRKKMRHEIRALQQKLKITTIFVTHDQDEAFEMSDRIVLLRGGQIQQLGTPEDIYDRPANRFVAEFIGEGSFLKVQLVSGDGAQAMFEADGGVRIAASCVGPVPAPGQQADILIRPEAVDISCADSSCAKDGSCVGGTVLERTFTGERVTFLVGLSPSVSIRCTKPAMPELRTIGVGQPVQLKFNACCIVGGETC